MTRRSSLSRSISVPCGPCPRLNGSFARFRHRGRIARYRSSSYVRASSSSEREPVTLSSRVRPRSSTSLLFSSHLYASQKSRKSELIIVRHTFDSTLNKSFLKKNARFQDRLCWNVLKVFAR